MVRTISGVLLVGLFLSTTPVAAQQATVLDRVVAVVDGEAILLSDLQRAEADINDRRVALESVIQRVLLEQLAEREGVEDAEVDGAVENVRRQTGLSEDAFWTIVRRWAYTRESYRSELRRELGVLRAVNRRLPRNAPLETIDEERERIRSELIRELRARAEIDIRI